MNTTLLYYLISTVLSLITVFIVSNVFYTTMKYETDDKKYNVLSTILKLILYFFSFVFILNTILFVGLFIISFLNLVDGEWFVKDKYKKYFCRQPIKKE